MTDSEETETPDNQLERSFRRLLRAYPSWYREERGEEMLTTLMDAAGERDRPTMGERVDVVFGGLRKHLAAGSLPAAVVGVLAALFVATLGAIGGAVAGWHTAADLPDDATADRIARQAIPDISTESYGDRSLFYWVSMEGQRMDTIFAMDDGDDHHAGHLSFDLEHPVDDYARFREAKARMAAAGWEVQSAREDSTSAEFTATRNGLDLKVSTWPYPNEPSTTTVTIARATPTLAPILTAAGLIIGGLVGWTLTARALRQFYREPSAWHTAAIGLLGIGGFLLVLPTAINLYFVAASLLMPEERVPVWLGYTVSPFATAALLGAGALVLSLLCGVVPKVVRQITQVAR